MVYPYLPHLAFLQAMPKVATDRQTASAIDLHSKLDRIGLRRLALLCSCAHQPLSYQCLLDWLCNPRLCGYARSNSPLLLFALLSFPSFHFYFDLQLTEISIDPAVLIRCHSFAEIAIPQHFATRHNISWGPDPSSVPARVYCDSPRTRQTESLQSATAPCPRRFYFWEALQVYPPADIDRSHGDLKWRLGRVAAYLRHHISPRREI